MIVESITVILYESIVGSHHRLEKFERFASESRTRVLVHDNRTSQLASSITTGFAADYLIIYWRINGS